MEAIDKVCCLGDLGIHLRSMSRTQIATNLIQISMKRLYSNLLLIR